MKRLHTSHLPASPLVLEAREKYEAGLIPREAYFAYKSQYDSAKRRCIPFLFSITDWWNFWSANGRWHDRGVGAGKMVMARNGDKGPYSPDNVYCATHAQNIADIDRTAMGRVLKASWAKKMADPNYTHHLAVRGDGHPQSRAVFSPAGRFGSGSLAAEAYGTSRGYVNRLAAARKQGWAWEDELTPPEIAERLTNVQPIISLKRRAKSHLMASPPKALGRPRKRIPVSCRICGISFEVCPGQQVRGEGKYCSHACSDQAKRRDPLPDLLAAD